MGKNRCSSIQMTNTRDDDDDDDKHHWLNTYSDLDTPL